MLGLQLAADNEYKALERYNKLSDQEKKAIKGSVIVSQLVSGLASTPIIAAASIQPSPLTMGAAVVAATMADIGSEIFVANKLAPLYPEITEDAAYAKMNENAMRDLK